MFYVELHVEYNLQKKRIIDTNDLFINAFVEMIYYNWEDIKFLSLSDYCVIKL